MKDPILVIFMRTDLNMSRGKMAVQAGHAVALTMFKTDVSTVEHWMLNNQVKIVLAVNGPTLGELIEKAKSNKIHWELVHDAGKTEVEPDTITCLAVGIESRRRLYKLTEGLKALR